ncbi:MAG: hypothetical protein ABSC19_17945 [Syntrophorhabdales bacterium]|jgi:hypothetical protein
MKRSFLMRLIVFTVLPLAVAAQAYGQAFPATGAAPVAPDAILPPPPPAEVTGPPDDASGDFPSAARTDFPGSTGGTDFPAAANPQGMDTTFPESGLGTGTDSTMGGSGTGSGGLDASTFGPYTSSPLGR